MVIASAGQDGGRSGSASFSRTNIIILVTHEHDIAQHAHRSIFLRDGKIASDQALKK